MKSHQNNKAGQHMHCMSQLLGILSACFHTNARCSLSTCRICIIQSLASSFAGFLFPSIDFCFALTWAEFTSLLWRLLQFFVFKRITFLYFVKTHLQNSWILMQSWFIVTFAASDEMSFRKLACLPTGTTKHMPSLLHVHCCPAVHKMRATYPHCFPHLLCNTYG